MGLMPRQAAIACHLGLDSCEDLPAELLSLDDGQVREGL